MEKRKNSEGGRARLSAAEGRALVEQWRRSGASMAEFCRRQAVGAHVLRYWLSREAPPPQPAEEASDFFVMSAPTVPEPAPSARALSGGSRCATNGAVIVMLPAVTSAELVRTLRGLLEEAQS